MISTTPITVYNFKNIHDFLNLEDFLKNYEQQKAEADLVVKEIRFNELDKWHFINNAKSENVSLEHESGKYFKIEGIKVSTNFTNFS